MYSQGGRILGFMVLAAAFLLGGCMNRENIPESEEEIGSMEETRIEMTAPEMEFLKSIYMDEDQIETGALYSYQKESLSQYRFAGQYLKEKYPGYEFEITAGTPMNRMNAYAVFYFRTGDDGCSYELHVSMGEDESLTGEDNFYGSLIRDAYDRYIYEECAAGIDSLVAVFSVITGVKGVTYDENLHVQDIITGEKPISPATEFYLGGAGISEEEWDAAVAQVERRVKELGLYGSYTVCYLADVLEEGPDGEECHNCLKNRNYLYKYTFQNFSR